MKSCNMTWLLKLKDIDLKNKEQVIGIVHEIIAEMAKIADRVKHNEQDIPNLQPKDGMAVVLEALKIAKLSKPRELILKFQQIVQSYELFIEDEVDISDIVELTGLCIRNKATHRSMLVHFVDDFVFTPFADCIEENDNKGNRLLVLRFLQKRLTELQIEYETDIFNPILLTIESILKEETISSEDLEKLISQIINIVKSEATDDNSKIQTDLQSVLDEVSAKFSLVLPNTPVPSFDDWLKMSAVKWGRRHHDTKAIDQALMEYHQNMITKTDTPEDYEHNFKLLQKVNQACYRWCETHLYDDHTSRRKSIYYLINCLEQNMATITELSNQLKEKLVAHNPDKGPSFIA